MGRRRTSLIEDIFDMLVQLPWWVGVTVAGVFWVIGASRIGGAGGNAVSSGMAPFIRMAFNLLAIISLVAAAVSAVRRVSRRELLDRQKDIDSLRSLSWRQFEQLVGEAYRRQGYDIQETGGAADGGIDILLRGKGETVLVQCKRWKTRSVGVDKVRELFGVVTAECADRGILVTSGKFTTAAQSFAAGKPLTLVDGPALAQLVRDVQPRSQASTPRPPPIPTPAAIDCPRCNSPMVLRTARRGSNAGSQFYGCSRFPQCRGIRSVD